MTKEQLIRMVISQIEEDILDGGIDAVIELLNFIEEDKLKGYLPHPLCDD